MATTMRQLYSITYNAPIQWRLVVVIVVYRRARSGVNFEPDTDCGRRPASLGSDTLTKRSGTGTGTGIGTGTGTGPVPTGKSP